MNIVEDNVSVLKLGSGLVLNIKKVYGPQRKWRIPKRGIYLVLYEM